MRSHNSPPLLRRALPFAAALASLLAAPTSRATSILEFPDNGSEQMGRGGAWVARASDPLAAFYNPAGLAGQETRLTLQSNFSTQNFCYTRQLATNDPTLEPLAGANGQFPQVCGSSPLGVDPQLGFTYRVNDRIGIGILPLVAPSAAGSNTTWPTFVADSRGVLQPAPQRYLLLGSNLVLVTPTIAAGFEVARGLRLGASFQWGIASFDFKNASAGTNGGAIMGQPPDPKNNDLIADLSGHQIFIPGFTLGAIWSPLDNFDLAGWYKYSAPVNTSADVKTTAVAFSGAAAAGKPTPPANLGDISATQVKLVLPMEAKLGFRYHQPRPGVPYDPHRRDPLAQDVFDAEVNLTWANNSASNGLTVRFPGDANGDGTTPIAGTPGFAPPNADIKTGFKDVVGVRVGGDVNVVPNTLAVRAGAFFETKGQDTTYMNIDHDGAQKIGIALGGTYRIHFGPPEKTHAIEVMLGVMHVFFADEVNNGPNGLPGLAGTPCNPVESPVPAGNSCTTGAQKYRTNWPVNLGTITNSVNVLNVGLTYRF